MTTRILISEYMPATIVGAWGSIANEEMHKKWKIIEDWCVARMGKSGPLINHLWSKSRIHLIGLIPHAIYIKQDIDIIAFKLTFGI